MKEIELKLRTKETYNELIKKLSKYITSNVTIQRDDIYLMPHQINKPIVTGSKIFRIRTIKYGSRDRALFTLKIQTDKRLVSNEYEFEISDPKIAREAMRASGLIKRITVEKKRIEGKIEEFNLCIDDVKHLGVFIELELLINDYNKESLSKRKMLTVFKQLNIKGEICQVPYDTQLEALKKRLQ